MGASQPQDHSCLDLQIHKTVSVQRIFRSIILSLSIQAPTSAFNDLPEMLLPADPAPKGRDPQAARGHPGDKVRGGGGREDCQGA